MLIVTNRKAFTLVEVIVILAVLAILAAIAVPLALRIFQTTAEDATRSEMQNLKLAMIGDPKKLNGTVRADFGFLGDDGRLPTAAENLDALFVKPGALSAWSFNAAKQAGAGWNGPYITGSFSGEEALDFKKDQWGNSYTYSDANFTNANGQAGDGKITSAGPDGQFGTGDDIIVEILVSETFATTVRGVLKTSAGDRIPSASVDINYPVNGTLTTTTATTDANGIYSFGVSIPFGKRSVQPRPTIVYAPNTALTTNGGQDMQFTILNMSSGSVTIASLVATFNSPGNNYQGIFWNGTQVNNQTRSSGQTANFAPTQTIAGTATTPPPQVVIIDGPDMQLPDLIVFAQGTSALVELRNWNNSITGIPMTITFNFSGGGSATVRFTPVFGG